MKQYVVTLQSVPGFMEQYGPGDVKVVAEDDEQAVTKAKRQLQLGQFPDRGPACWKVVGVRQEYE